MGWEWGSGVVITIGSDGNVGGGYMLRIMFPHVENGGCTELGGLWWTGPGSMSPCWFWAGVAAAGPSELACSSFWCRELTPTFASPLVMPLDVGAPTFILSSCSYPSSPPCAPTTFSLSHSPKISSTILRLLSSFPSSSSYSWWTLGPLYGGWVLAAPGVGSIVIAAGNNFEGVCPWMGEGMLSCMGAYAQVKYYLLHVGMGHKTEEERRK
ncbi:hypothetical protein ARMSODRAFT_976259 [Armillaria solidipes]|uniref:Uncharacterized protein n=1 Tax=Armillaria solidipes TaxID=1076256 RepID=A0A2H3BE75_9AGAR|nr:hypothetical protein ARMSODRAFT_976259 [Armillaria solidipes]